MAWFVGAPVALAKGDESLVPPAADLTLLLPPDRHVTFVFLGNVRDGTGLACWDAIPSLELPEVVVAVAWERFGRSAVALELSDGDGRFDAVAAACHGAVAPFVPVEPPSPFRPHVTMARVPRKARGPSATALRGWNLPTSPLRVGPLTLFTSAAVDSAHRYEAVKQQ